MANRDRLIRVAYSKVTTDSQEPSAEDYATINAAIPELLDDIARPQRLGVLIADVDSIPDAYVQHLALLLAATVADDFGKPMSADMIAFAEGRLRAIAAGGYAHGPARVDYF